MEKSVIVSLSPSDADLFVEFRKVQDVFSVLSENGVFTTRNGKAILNFNAEGVLDSIEFNVKGYKRTS